MIFYEEKKLIFEENKGHYEISKNVTCFKNTRHVLLFSLDII